MKVLYLFFFIFSKESEMVKSVDICSPVKIDTNILKTCNNEDLTSYLWSMYEKKSPNRVMFDLECQSALTTKKKIEDDPVLCAACYAKEIKAALDPTLKAYNLLIDEVSTKNTYVMQKTQNLLKGIIANAKILEDETSTGFLNIITHPFCKNFSEDLMELKSNGKGGLVASNDFLSKLSANQMSGMKQEVDTLLESEDLSNIENSSSSNPTMAYTKKIIAEQYNQVKEKKNNFQAQFKSLPEEVKKELENIEDPGNFITTLDKKMSLIYGKCLKEKFGSNQFQAKLKQKGYTGNKSSGMIYDKILTESESIEEINKKLQSKPYSFYKKSYLSQCNESTKASYPFLKKNYKNIIEKHYSTSQTNFKKNIKNIFYGQCTLSLKSFGGNPTEPLCLKNFDNNVNQLKSCQTYIGVQKEGIEKILSTDKQSLKVSLDAYQKELNSKLKSIAENLQQNKNTLKTRTQGVYDVNGIEAVAAGENFISFSDKVLNDFNLKNTESLLNDPSTFFKNSEEKSILDILKNQVSRITDFYKDLDKGMEESQKSVDEAIRVIRARIESCESSSNNKAIICKSLETQLQLENCIQDNTNNQQRVSNYCNITTSKPDLLKTCCEDTNNLKNFCHILKYIQEDCNIKAEQGSNVTSGNASIGSSGNNTNTSNTSIQTNKQ